MTLTDVYCLYNAARGIGEVPPTSVFENAPSRVCVLRMPSHAPVTGYAYRITMRVRLYLVTVENACLLVLLAEMVSPLDLKKACLSFEKLQLPLRLRNLKSGVTVVESAMASAEQVDERMKAAVADKGEETFGMFWPVSVVRHQR